MLPDFTVQVLSDDWLPGWMTQLIAVSVGGAITLVSTFGVELMRERSSTKRLARAIAAEVHATLQMLAFRGAIDFLNEAYLATTRGERRISFFSVGDDYLPVTRSAAAHAGSMPGQVPSMLAELLVLTRSAKLDLDDLADTDSLIRQASIEELGERYRQLVVILSRGYETGTRLVKEIDRHYGNSDTRMWSDPS